MRRWWIVISRHHFYTNHSSDEEKLCNLDREVKKISILSCASNTVEILLCESSINSVINI